MIWHAGSAVTISRTAVGCPPFIRDSFSSSGFELGTYRTYSFIKFWEEYMRVSVKNDSSPK